MGLRVASRSVCRFYGGILLNRKVVQLCCNRAKVRIEHRTLCSGISRCGFNDYEKEKESWNLIIPEKFNFAHDVIDVWASKERKGLRNASLPAFWYVSETGQEVKWNFQMLEYESKRVANFLQCECGVERGDNMIVMLPKIPEFWLVNLAAIRLGAVLSPASMMLTRKDLTYRLSAFSPSCMIVHESVLNLVDEVARSFPSLKTKIVVSHSKISTSRNKDWRDFHELQNSATDDHQCADTNSDESMAVFFTSGTTGQPKMAEHSHSSYGIGHLTTGRYLLDLTSESVMWSLSDTGWAKTAYSGIFGPWSWGSCSFVHGMPRFSAPLTLQCIDIIESWKEATGLQLYDGYGQTETVLTTGMFKCIEYRPGSMGKAQPGIDVVILDENKNELGPGENGEIALKKRNGYILGAFKGYRDEPEKTKKKLTDKYLLTGDMGYYDKDGYFYFVGRNDDLINSAGYRIGPFEVEGALLEHPAVLEVAVTSSPDASRGEVVKAFIVLKDTYLDKPQSTLIKELQDHTKRITAPYKYPRKIEFVKELPKTTSGKVRRIELKQREWKKENKTAS